MNLSFPIESYLLFTVLVTLYFIVTLWLISPQWERMFGPIKDVGVITKTFYSVGLYAWPVIYTIILAITIYHIIRMLVFGDEYDDDKRGG